LTSLFDVNGLPPGDFLMADVFGVSYTGQMSKRVNYLDLSGCKKLLDNSGMLSCNRPSPLIRAITANVIAYLVEPIFDPDDPDHWASIHSNPPGKVTEFVGLAVNQYGQGRCIYLAAPILGIQQDAQKVFGTWLLDQYTSREILISTNAPPCVEITILNATTKKAYLVCFVNYQRELPNVPVRDLSAHINLPSTIKPKRIYHVSDGQTINNYVEGKGIIIKMPYLDTLEMIAIEYE